MSHGGATVVGATPATTRPKWPLADRRDWAMNTSTTWRPGTAEVPSTRPGQLRRARRRGRFGAWRALVRLPSIIGGAAVALTLTAGLGRWQGPALLVWLGVGVLVSTPPGERLAARLVLGFRPLSASQRQLLGPVSTAALARCGLAPAAFDWYVQPGRRPNACIAGRRTHAVTQGALESFLAGRLPADLLAAVLVHELGHHATRAGRFGLAVSWYAGPGRLAFRLVVALAVLACGGRRPGRVTWLVVAAGGAVAIVQTALQRQWLSVTILSAVAFALIGTPLLDALISRASEHAADRYAAAVGAESELARALQVITEPSGLRHGVATRLLDRHPSVADRLTRLDEQAGALPG